MKSLTFFASLVVFATASAKAHEVQNGGGSVVVGGSRYEIADLHFRPVDGVGFVFTQELSDTLGNIAENLNEGLATPLVDPNGREFFQSQVFNTDIEYRLVATLPTSCHSSELASSIPLERDGVSLSYITVACTQGSITWIRAEEFSKMPLVDQAYLLIHERLHAFAPFEPYEIKADFIKILFYLNERVLPQVRQVQNDLRVRASLPEWLLHFEYEDKTLLGLNRLSRRRRQLCGIDRGDTRDVQIKFYKTGGIKISGAHTVPKLVPSAGLVIPKVYFGSVFVRDTE